MKSLGEVLMGPEHIFQPDLKDDKWKKYGFQSKNPRTDFRGAGILGVLNLTYFAKNYSDVTFRTPD